MSEKIKNDILNSQGKEKNFITNKKYSDVYKILAKKWSQLPIYKNSKTTKKFFDYLKTKQVILISSGTGSGKTVIIPKYFLKYIITNNIDGKIAITNPKTLTTVKNAEYGAKTLDVELGNEVGYKFRNSPENCASENTRLLYVTDGYILALTSGKDKYLSEYIGIIIDEVHERHIQIDLLLKLMKEIVLIRPEFKLIIMSATIDSELFRNYYDLEGISYGELYISGSANFPIKQIWGKNDIPFKNYKIHINNIVKDIIELKLKIDKNSVNDVLVFVPTKKDTFDGCKFINETFTNSKIKINTKKNKSSKEKKIFCVEIFSNTEPDKVSLAVSADLYKKLGYNIKFIYATNVAESSITFDKLTTVVDSGLELSNYYNSEYNYDVVELAMTTQAQIIQRIGRTGRTNPGTAYHLYTKKTFDTLLKFPSPGILKIDLTPYIIQLMQYNRTYRNLKNFLNDLLTPPSDIQVQNSMIKLKFTKCIIKKEDDIVLSPIGYAILKFKTISLMSSIAILLSILYRCHNEIIIIVAIDEITCGKLNLLFNFNSTDNSILNKLKHYSYKNSDHITILNIYNKLWKKQKTTYLNIELFEKIDKLINELIKSCSKLSSNTLEYIKNIYGLTNKKLYSTLEDNILFVIGKSHLLHLIENNITINNSKDLKGKYSFSNITVNNTKLTTFKYGICSHVVKLFDQILFTNVSLIPEYINIIE